MGEASAKNSEEVVATTATRNTIQRALVLEAVRSLHGHPTSADVYEVVRERHPNISRATVYRNLNVLVDRGAVLRVEVPNGADRFDFHIDMPYQHDLAEKVNDAHGFAIEQHHIIFEGICPECAKG